MTVLEVHQLKKHYRLKPPLPFQAKKLLRAVDGVSFSIGHGETLSLVGESGCGKSTVGRSVLGLLPIDGGEILLDGVRLDRLSEAGLRSMRRRMQVIFQDPFSSLNPRMKVRDIIAEPLTNFERRMDAETIDRRVSALLDRVGLPRDAVSRWPHEFSGGQRQRIGIARALAVNPELIVCDEAVSALDVSVKAQIVNLLQDLQRELGLSLLFISHDLGIVAHMTHRVAVMYLGRIVEIGSRDEIFLRPNHPYTSALLSAVPSATESAGGARIVLKGELPSAVDPPRGCRFHTRCPRAFERCKSEEPVLKTVGPSHESACHLNDGSSMTQHPIFLERQA